MHTRERVLDSGGFESIQCVLASEPLVESSESGARWLDDPSRTAVRFTLQIGLDLPMAYACRARGREHGLRRPELRRC